MDYTNITTVEGLAATIGVSGAMVFVLVGLLAAWTIVLKGFALWHSARGSQTGWFIALLIVNTIGILEIIYLLFFRKK